ncbi:hypothetical protein HK102_002404, partial [Quaeritorhiza haematococci]
MINKGVGGRIQDLPTIRKILDTFHAHGHKELDTARMYCNGNTEEVLAELQVQTKTEWGPFSVATKAYPFQPGMHSKEKLKEQFRASLKALNSKRVDIFYLHAPDHATPFEETLRAVQDLYEEGTFGELGLSNYAAWEVMEIWWICKTNGYVMPTLYQGMYNALTREVERELIPCLRKLNMRFYAYNPLCGGLLTDKPYTIEQGEGNIEQGSRFDPKTSQGDRYRQRYWNEVYFTVIENIKKACAKHSIPTASAAHRWMVHHSLLDASRGDGIIIGASSVAHAEQNLKDCEDPNPLPNDIVQAFDDGWMKTKAVCA